MIVAIITAMPSHAWMWLKSWLPQKIPNNKNISKWMYFFIVRLVLTRPEASRGCIHYYSYVPFYFVDDFVVAGVVGQSQQVAQESLVSALAKRLEFIHTGT